MTKPELRSRRRALDPEKEARIDAFSATPETAPDTSPKMTLEPVDKEIPKEKVLAAEPKSKGFNYRMTPTRHREINEMRAEDERSFQWMLDKLFDLGIEAWKNKD